MGGGDLEGGDRAAEAPEQGDRLGGREGEVEAGDRALAGDALAAEQGLAAGGVVAGEHRGELVGLDLAGEAEVARQLADPLARRLALAGVVVLGAFGDLVEVVALLAGAELPDGEHRGYVRREGARRPHFFGK